jgi:hypothetical protein
VFTDAGAFTNVYAPQGTIEEWILSLGDVVREGLLNNGALESTVKLLFHIDSPQFPHVEPSRYHFAFVNGVYSSQACVFSSYGARSSEVPCMYYALPFDAQSYQNVCEASAYRYPAYDIPTPAMQQILDHQELPLDECVWFYVLLGSRLYPQGMHDKWELFWHIMGQAGTGKSCALDFIRGLFPRKKVGTLSNNIELTLGLMGMLDVWTMMGPDMNGFFRRFDSTNLQQMASGETMALATKNSDPVRGKWMATVTFVSNGQMGFEDFSGQISRRLAQTVFRKPVANADTELVQRLGKELPALLYKITKMYRQMAKENGKTADR